MLYVYTGLSDETKCCMYTQVSVMRQRQLVFSLCSVLSDEDTSRGDVFMLPLPNTGLSRTELELCVTALNQAVKHGQTQ